MPLVIDVSVMASWHFPDEYNVESAAILEMLRGRKHEARVPGIWWFEIYNVLVRGERRGRSTLQQTAQFQDLIGELPITIAPIADPNAILNLARRHHLTFYDAAYLELAQREKVALATLDQALARAASAEAVPLISA
ncbi:type II toxin-antitoxin system VapC family toxin [Rhodopseudomonas sp. P2A-2r]|uniref:type II toxin-antitoxin system VapC family toxin n=1 Tax=unclassified Rhodopseudomonas TaxID=2638247 RepID=UPI0022348B0F|nr:type II toxin-antitoxin system VapC family toxin [Rhodopseudomonas sp. P2A-2r]UZE49665.1 type II toxin-antitoxin system VapC family toxin [Rhodopseudomonas sp. P2A-2r]